MSIDSCVVFFRVHGPYLAFLSYVTFGRRAKAGKRRKTILILPEKTPHTSRLTLNSPLLKYLERDLFRKVIFRA